MDTEAVLRVSEAVPERISEDEFVIAESRLMYTMLEVELVVIVQFVENVPF